MLSECIGSGLLDDNAEEFKARYWDELAIPSSTPLDYVTTHQHRNKLRERLNDEIHHLESDLRIFPSEEISRHLEAIRLDDLSTTTYTRARSMLLSLELEHTERCQKLAILQREVSDFLEQFIALSDSIKNERLVDSVPAIQSRLAMCAHELLRIAGVGPPRLTEDNETPPIEINTQSTVKVEATEEPNQSSVQTESVAAPQEPPGPKKAGRGRPRKKRPLPSEDRQPSQCAPRSQERPLYIIEKIVGYDDRPGIGVFYKVQWEGYPGQDTWEPEKEIIEADAEDLILDYKRRWNSCHPKHLHWPLPEDACHRRPENPPRSSTRCEPPSKRRRSRKTEHEYDPASAPCDLATKQSCETSPSPATVSRHSEKLPPRSCSHHPDKRAASAERPRHSVDSPSTTKRIQMRCDSISASDIYSQLSNSMSIESSLNSSQNVSSSVSTSSAPNTKAK